VDSVTESFVVNDSKVFEVLDVDLSINSKAFRAYISFLHFSLEQPKSANVDAICLTYIGRSKDFSRLKEDFVSSSMHLLTSVPGGCKDK